MGRPKEFDRDVALDRAIEVFWEKGYEDASVQDLVDRMEICRSSLYDTFGAKDALYRESIDRYIARAEEEFRRTLHAHASPRRSIEQWLRGLPAKVGAKDAPTCLLLKSSVMRCHGCPEITARIRDWSERTVTLLEERLVAAAERGEIAENRARRQTARLLVNASLGLKVHAGLAVERAVLVETVEAALRLLDPEAP